MSCTRPTAKLGALPNPVDMMNVSRKLLWGPLNLGKHSFFWGGYDSAIIFRINPTAKTSCLPPPPGSFVQVLSSQDGLLDVILNPKLLMQVRLIQGYREGWLDFNRWWRSRLNQKICSWNRFEHGVLGRLRLCCGLENLALWREASRGWENHSWFALNWEIVKVLNMGFTNKSVTWLVH